MYIKSLNIVLLIVLTAATGCTGADIPSVQVPLKENSDAGSRSASKGNPDNKDGNSEPKSGKEQLETKPSPERGESGKGSAVIPFTLAEAKTKCVACHVKGKSGEKVWSTADGSEGDWKQFASSAKMSVTADRMPQPPLAAQDKAKMIAFLNRLLGISSDNSSIPSPKPVFNFDAAKTLCVGCHSSGGESPRLETLSQWRSEKDEIKKEVSKNRMPRGKSITAEEKKSLLEFIDTL